MALAPTGDPMVAKMNTILTASGYTVKVYESDDVIDALVRDANYGGDIPYICFGLSF